MSNKLKAKDPEAVDFYHIVWCSASGVNDGGSEDIGRLQGAVITDSQWAVSPGSELTIDASNTAAITIRGIEYAINTVATVKLSAGNAGSDYELTNTITTDDGRTLESTITIRVREQ